MIPSSYADIFADAIPHARVTLMEDAGHLPYIEKAEEFNEAAINFLKEPSPAAPLP